MTLWSGQSLLGTFGLTRVRHVIVSLAFAHEMKVGPPGSLCYATVPVLRHGHDQDYHHHHHHYY
jgi:hypothetical protein